jgi:hypothetical protein
MNHHHRKTLHALFSHPVSGNLSFKEVDHLLQELGAVCHDSDGGRRTVKLNGHSAAFSTHHHSMPPEEIAQMRKYLERCGINPEAYPL